MWCNWQTESSHRSQGSTYTQGVATYFDVFVLSYATPVTRPCLVEQMSTFSIGDADDEDDFAQLRQTKTAAASGKDGKITKLGAVPLKTSEQPNKGALVVFGERSLSQSCIMKVRVAGA